MLGLRADDATGIGSGRGRVRVVAGDVFGRVTSCRLERQPALIDARQVDRATEERGHDGKKEGQLQERLSTRCSPAEGASRPACVACRELEELIACHVGAREGNIARTVWGV